MAKDSWPFYTHWEPRFIGILNNAPLVDLVDLAGSSITTTIIDTIMCIIMSKWGRGGRNMVIAVSAVLYVSYGPD